MVIRIQIIICLFTLFLCQSQAVDSLESGYDKYYNSALLASSESGEFVILKHHNSFGKNEDELFNTVNKQSISLGKYLNYQFLGDQNLMMNDNAKTRFQNLKTNDYSDIPGNYSSSIIEKYNTAVLYDRQAKELVYCTGSGLKKWGASNVIVYDTNEKLNRMAYFDGKKINIRGLDSDLNKSFVTDDDIKWLKIYNGHLYFASITATHMRLHDMDLKSYQITDQLIDADPGFVFAESLITYFEIRENGHFIFPLYLKDKMDFKEDPELKITYSNVNSKDKYLNHHLGIYNLKEKLYDYHPKKEDLLPLYKFLNEKGDFVVYDQSIDTVEYEDNVVRDLKLFLNYGKESYVINQITAEEGNYLWDQNTRKFIYFKNKRWWCKIIDTGEDREILPLNTAGWSDNFRNGIAKNPESSPVKIVSTSSVLLTNQFDYFVLNLDSYKLEKVTRGEENKVKYKLQLSKDHFPESNWNVRLATVDLSKELLFKLENKEKFHFGFATYSHKNKNTVIYEQGHYREAVHIKNGLLMTSEFAMEPLSITKTQKNNSEIVYKALGNERKVLETMQYKIFQYTTSYGTSQAALLFPVNYDKRKAYPMIVNMYENQTREVQYFDAPHLRARDGFNYMHYLLNGYFVLLPDLQYDLNNVKLGMIESLEKSVDTANSIESIDNKNIGILGLSHGGYETGLALGNSRYFKTGVTGVMISDLISYALSNSAIRTEPNYLRVENHQVRMRNSLFDDWNNYLENSPIYHLKNVSSPVLIWTGVKDPNIPTTQSKMFFLGMKRLRKNAVLLEYINETHTMNSKKNKLDINHKIFEWFEYYLKSKKPAKWMLPLIK